MKDIVTFCQTTKNKVEEDIKSKENTIKTKTNATSFREMDQTLKNIQEKRIKSLQQGKNQKFYRLKYHANQQNEQPERTGRLEKDQPREPRRIKSASRSKSNHKVSYAEKVKQHKNKPQTGSNNGRDQQIEQLQKQIDQLRNDRKNNSVSTNSKSAYTAPSLGATNRPNPQQQNDHSTEMSNAEIFSLIKNTMQTLNAYAARLEQQGNSLQTPRGM